MRNVLASLYTLAASSRSRPATVSMAERSGEPCKGWANTFEMLVAGCADRRLFRHFGCRPETDELELELRMRLEEEDGEEDMDVGVERVHGRCGAPEAAVGRKRNNQD